ncbi:serpentine type 7TM GPCR chemoreceptor srt domain-containing protein [Ditylenchus destructor]|uniref:Serpentine type 7TM GPCR chemoreceptor srt domain-containing protein n=1 Tax=Ditylenchus destructor TaxID=166010 RepID=A0AAD4QYK6_9BILA|nr:serpentine type 7TM GPCR chemoreceptor srt domain-containing protein [Ditylenchus destructor]
MEMYFFNPQEWDRLYLNGCRYYDIDLHPLEERKHVFIGWTFIFQFFFYMVLYIPCIFAISKHMKQPCYKFMFVIGITDCLCLIGNAFFTGYFSITGQVFCSTPHLQYWVGLLTLDLWIIETWTDMFLALNRCVETISSRLADVLFKGKRTWLWFIPIGLYALYFATFTKPAVFSSVYVCWYFNPHVGYIDLDDNGALYANYVHAINNMIILFGVSGLYIVFLIAMVMKLCTVRAGSKLSVSQWMTFLQVLAISFFNGYAAALYVYLQYVPVTQFLMYTATYSWTTAHGLPCVIYILLNKTIRDDLIKMCKGSFKLNRTNNSSTAKVTPMAGSIQSTSKGTMFLKQWKQKASKDNIEKFGQQISDRKI